MRSLSLKSVTRFIQGNASVVADLFGWGEDVDYPTLTGNDESVKTPGLFLLGSQVRHQAKEDLWIFCFIYKYVLWLCSSERSTPTTRKMNIGPKFIRVKPPCHSLHGDLATYECR